MGIEQVNKALTQMDEVTQQNSALVEENAATAKTLEDQSLALDGRVAAFRLIEGEVLPAAAHAAKAAPRQARPVRGNARQIQTALAHALVDEMDEF
jgi:methyl-accepting chemotaxis protein